jgi:hypothetical protein
MRLARWHDAIGDDVEERQSGGHRGGFFVDDPWDGRRFLTFASRIPFFAPRTARRMCLPPDLRPLHGRMLRRVPRYVLVKPVVASENDLPAAIRAGREQSLQARLEDSAKCGVIAGTGLLGGGRDGRAVDPGPNHRLCAGSRTGYRSERPPEQPDRPSSWTLLIGRKPLFEFAACVALFHFANAPTLPPVGAKLALAHAGRETALMSACVIAAAGGHAADSAERWRESRYVGPQADFLGRIGDSAGPWVFSTRYRTMRSGWSACSYSTVSTGASSGR